MLLRVGIGDTSFNPGGTRHASLALARNRDVIYVASVNWYIFVSTTHLNHGKCYTVYIHIHKDIHQQLTANTCTLLDHESLHVTLG